MNKEEQKQKAYISYAESYVKINFPLREDGILNVGFSERLSIIGKLSKEEVDDYLNYLKGLNLFDKKLVCMILFNSANDVSELKKTCGLVYRDKEKMILGYLSGSLIYQSLLNGTKSNERFMYGLLREFGDLLSGSFVFSGQIMKNDSDEEMCNKIINGDKVLLPYQIKELKIHVEKNLLEKSLNSVKKKQSIKM